MFYQSRMNHAAGESEEQVKLDEETRVNRSQLAEEKIFFKK
jgi:hypothetical protein